MKCRPLANARLALFNDANIEVNRLSSRKQNLRGGDSFSRKLLYFQRARSPSTGEKYCYSASRYSRAYYFARLPRCETRYSKLDERRHRINTRIRSTSSFDCSRHRRRRPSSTLERFKNAKKCQAVTVSTIFILHSTIFVRNCPKFASTTHTYGLEFYFK